MKTINIENNKILTEKQKIVLKHLSNILDCSNCYWAGGTGLAAVYEHRLSEDLDIFFTKDNVINFDKIINQLTKKFDVQVETNLKNDTLNIFVDDLKVQILRDFYTQVGKRINTTEKIKIASIKQIGYMKLLAVMNRGSKKDFIDLYIIEQNGINIIDLINSISERYENIKNVGHLIKSLEYFEDADKDVTPKMFINVDWNKIKKYFIKIVRNYRKQYKL
jgi:predicted nucleotidyltransferase component of viral defense system